MAHVSATPGFDSHRPALTELSVEDIQPLITESDLAFLPSVDDPGQTTTSLIAELQSDPAFQVLGYMIDGKPASYVIALGNKEPDTISIGPMYVGTEYRGRGLGRQQVEDFIGQARASNYGSVFTKTWGNNHASTRIFDELGFNIHKIEEHDRVDGDATVSYWLDL